MQTFQQHLVCVISSLLIFDAMYPLSLSALFLRIELAPLLLVHVEVLLALDVDTCVTHLVMFSFIKKGRQNQKKFT